MNKKFKKFYAGLSALAIVMLISTSGFAGGQLRVGWYSAEMLDSLNCSSSWQYETQGCMFWQVVYDQLWMLDSAPAYNLKPWAVESFETEDRIKWRFRLREGMTFHDGKPVTADDLAFTMTYLPISEPTYSYNDSQTVEDSIVIIDDRTVEFELKQKLGDKYVPFNYYPILPKSLWKRYKFKLGEYSNKKAIGSGPFKLKEFSSGKYIVFEKFEEHWDKSPRVDQIVFKSYGGNDAMNMALRHGEIDMLGYTSASPIVKKYYEKDPNIDVLVNPGISLIWLTYNLHPTGPIQDLRVRKAIAHAINKDRIVKMVYHGFAKVHDSFVYPELEHYNPDLPKYNYDVELAGKMLKEAGYKDTDGDGLREDPATGEKIRLKLLIASEMVELVKTGTLMREMLKDIGIDIELNVVDQDTYYDLYYYPAGNSFDLAFGFEEPGPYAGWVWEFMRSIDGGGAGWNTAFYNNPELDKVIDGFSAEDDMEKRKELSWKLQKTMAEDLPHYVLFRPDHIAPVRTDKLDGYVSTMGGVSNWINPNTYYFVHEK
ncbi:MAG: peptide ABC transporter substrate-binding protein [Desulfobacterales bacterium]|nr:peptide ABC transporter substrate-binding protein [Desulfobacterales bacterium]